MKPKGKKRIYGKEERNKLIFKRYIIDGLSVYEIGKEFNITAQRVADILRDGTSYTAYELHETLHKEASQRRKINLLNERLKI